MNLDDLLSQVKIDGTIEAKEFINAFLFSGDNSYLNELRTDFKTKFVEPFSKKIKSIREDDIKRIFDPLGVTDISSNDFKDKLKSYKKKVEDFLNVKLPDANDFKKQPESVIKDAQVSSLIPENIKKPNENGNESFFQNLKNSLQVNFKSLFDNFKILNQKQDDGEQENIGEKINKIDFSDETKKFLRDLLLKDFLSKLQSLKIESSNKSEEAQQRDSSFGGLSTLVLIGTILAGTVGSIINLGKELYTSIKTILTIPSKIMQALKEEGLYKFADYKAWFELKWEKYVTEPLKKIPGFESFMESINNKWTKLIDKIKEITKFDEITNSINLKWTEFIEKAKNFTKFEELSTAISIKMEKYIISPINSGLEFLKSSSKVISGIFEYVMGFFKGSDGISLISKTIEGTFSFLRGLITPLKTSFELIFPFVKPIMGFFKFLDKFLGPIAILIDPVVDAFSTLFDVWSDDNLTPLQKGISVLTSFVVGFGDIFTFLIDLLSKGVTGIWNFITGKGFKTDNAVSEWMEKSLYQGKGSLGAGAGKAVAESFKLKNTPDAKSLAIKPDSSDTEAPNKNNNQKAVPMNDGLLESTGVPIKMSLGKQNFETAPDDNILTFKSGGFLDRSLLDLKIIMKDVHSSILNLNKNLIETSNLNNKNINITNNNSTNASSNSKEYLMGDVRDVISDNRLSWWAQSERIRATV
jgi:hypothetical protein